MNALFDNLKVATDADIPWGGVALSGWDALFDNLKVGYDADDDDDLDGSDDVVIDEDFAAASVAPTHDDAGNLTKDADYAYGYDAWNNLVQVRAQNDADVVVGVYAYYADNRRASKTVTNRGELDGVTYFFYDGLREIEERNGSEQVTQQYVWGHEYLDQLLMIRGAGGTWFVHQDANWNVIALTTPNGDVAEEVQYQPYGSPQIRRHLAFGDADADGDVDASDSTARTNALSTYNRAFDADFDGDVSNTSGDADQLAWDASYNDPSANVTMVVANRSFSPTGNPFLFTGRRLDAENGLYFYRFRTYHPALKTFIQRDPLGYVDSASLYQYVGGMPFSLLDPLGLRTQVGDDPPLPVGDDVPVPEGGWPSNGGLDFRPMRKGEHKNKRPGMEDQNNTPHCDVYDGGKYLGKIEVETGRIIGAGANEDRIRRAWLKVLKDKKQRARVDALRRRLNVSALAAIAMIMYAEYAEALGIIADDYQALLEAIRAGDLALVDQIIARIAEKIADEGLGYAYLKFLEDWYGEDGWEKKVSDAYKEKKKKEQEEKYKHPLPAP